MLPGDRAAAVLAWIAWLFLLKRRSPAVATSRVVDMGVEHVVFSALVAVALVLVRRAKRRSDAATPATAGSATWPWLACVLSLCVLGWIGFGTLGASVLMWAVGGLERLCNAWGGETLYPYAEVRYGRYELLNVVGTWWMMRFVAMWALRPPCPAWRSGLLRDGFAVLVVVLCVPLLESIRVTGGWNVATGIRYGVKTRLPGSSSGLFGGDL